MSSARPLVSAVIVCKDQRDRVLASLGCFFASADVPVEAVVVDNASTDGSADAVAAGFPAVKLVRRVTDSGFGRAGNAGLAVADGRFVLLLDPMVKVQAGCVGRLVDFMLTRPDVGATSPRLEDPSGHLIGAARRGFPTPSSHLYASTGLSRLFPRSARYNRHNMGHRKETDEHEIDSGSVACLMLRRAAVDRVGFFDPEYSRYGEDLDLCYRLRTGGWKVYFVPAAKAGREAENLPKAEIQRRLWDQHKAFWTFHAKHYAPDLPAFSNGLVWASNWVRWGYLAVRVQITGDPALSP